MLSPNFSQGLVGDDTGASRVFSQNVTGQELIQFRRGPGVGGHHESPMAIVVTFILQDQCLGPVKQEYAAEHIVMADIFEKIRSRSVIPNRQAEMMIVETYVPGQVGLRAGKTENAGFTISAYLIIDKGWPAVRAINDNSGEQAFGGPALRNRAGGIKNIDRRVLVASDVTERDAGNATAGNLLQIQGTAPAAEDLDVVTPGTDQLNGLLGAE